MVTIGYGYDGGFSGDHNDNGQLNIYWKGNRL